MIILFTLVISIAFFTMSLVGFGGGLIAVPLLSLFWPVQDVVAAVMIFQIAMGLLIFKTWRQTNWRDIRDMIPGTVVGAFLGVLALKYIPADGMRLILASYIIIHLMRSHTKYDLIGKAVEKGGAMLSGFLGGMFNAMIGGGAPAFVVYLKERAKETVHFRADVTAILFIANIPRIIGTVATGLVNTKMLTMVLYAFPCFLLALYLGQKLHDKVPQKHFFKAVDVILVCTALSLILKALL